MQTELTMSRASGNSQSQLACKIKYLDGLCSQDYIPVHSGWYLVLVRVVSHSIEVSGEVAKGVVVSHGKVEHQTTETGHLLRLPRGLHDNSEKLLVSIT